MDTVTSLFNPIQVTLTEITREGVDAALTEEAQRIRCSTSPQEPIVIITQSHDSSFFDACELLFDLNNSAFEGPVYMDDPGELGGSIIEHIHDDWMDHVDETGRSLSWNPDYVPSARVMMFYAPTPLAAYLRTVMAIADGAEIDEVTDLRTAFMRLDPQDQFIDIDTPMLFLHLDVESGTLSIANPKMSDVVDEAQKYFMSEPLFTDEYEPADMENRADDPAELMRLVEESSCRAVNLELVQLNDSEAFNKLTRAMMALTSQALSNPAMHDAFSDYLQTEAWALGDGRLVIKAGLAGLPEAHVLDVPAGGWTELSPEQARAIDEEQAARAAEEPSHQDEFIERATRLFADYAEKLLPENGSQQVPAQNIIVCDRSPTSMETLELMLRPLIRNNNLMNKWLASDHGYFILSLGERPEMFWSTTSRSLQTLLAVTLPEMAEAIGEDDMPHTFLNTRSMKKVAADELKATWSSLGGMI